MLYYNKKLKRHSQELRKNMTDAERLLWSKLRMRQLNGVQFYRQRILGDHIVDFYCPKANLVIEHDGGQHYTEEGKAKDKKRDEYLESLGLTILRFSDKDVCNNLDGILMEIEKSILLISPIPSLEKRGIME